MIEFNNLEHGFEIANLIPRIYNPASDVVISRSDDDGRLLGGVIYTDKISNCIFMHQGGMTPKWMTKDLLWVFFDYPFNQLKVGKVCGTIPSSKPELQAFNERLGFVVETSIKGAYKDGDLLIMSMTRDQCRWLNVKPTTIRSNK